MDTGDLGWEKRYKELEIENTELKATVKEVSKMKSQPYHTLPFPPHIYLVTLIKHKLEFKNLQLHATENMKK